MAKKLLEEGNCHVVKWNTINEAVDKNWTFSGYIVEITIRI